LNDLLVVEDLAVHFHANGRTARAVDGVSFSVEPGKTVGLVGESGCGKTVTALSILGLVRAENVSTRGRVLFQGRDLLPLKESEKRRFRGKKIGMIFQEPMTSLNPVLTVGDQIREVLKLHKGLDRREGNIRASELLGQVGISDPGSLLSAYPGSLSGGMRQRIMIAVAMAAGPELLIADEPTTALDVTVQAQVLALIDRLRIDTGTGVLLVTHDLGVVAEVCDEVVVMYAGKVAERAEIGDFFSNPLHPYSRGLLEAVHSLSAGNVVEAIRGQVSPADDYPPGCRFHPRCPQKMKICESVQPIGAQIERTAVFCHLFSENSPVIET
jgi:peptide/nickel transport system ATP-binding protein